MTAISTAPEPGITRTCRNCGKALTPSQAWSCSTACSGAIGGRHRLAEVKPCGTSAAYRRHYRRGEPIDALCRQAQARIDADRRARRAATQASQGASNRPGSVSLDAETVSVDLSGSAVTS